MLRQYVTLAICSNRLPVDFHERVSPGEFAHPAGSYGISEAYEEIQICGRNRCVTYNLSP
jgi:hypothetical protein